MGWMALFCALPMWVTSINWVRRKYYSLFKLAHWLFIGFFVFSVMHVSVNSVLTVCLSSSLRKVIDSFPKPLRRCGTG